MRKIRASTGQSALAPGRGFGDTLPVSEAAVANRACALCGRPGSPRYQGLHDRLFDVPAPTASPEGWSLLACTDCRLVWLDPMPEGDNARALYESYYTHEDDPSLDSPLYRAVTRGIPAARMGYPEPPATDTVERALASALSWIGPLREIAEHAVMWLPVSRRGRLLDVGCGSGAFLERMRDFGWQVAGVEPDPGGRTAASTRLGTAGTVVASLEDEALPSSSFDAITLSHVIEHVPDPVATLRQCHRLLAPGGLLVCVTPNAASLGARSFASSWLHWDPPRHLHVFGPEALERAVREAGLEVQRVATPGSTAHFVWQASTLIERDGRLPGARVQGVSPALWLESVAFWILEYGLTRAGRRVGEEVLVVAEKSRA
jgi:2-polyprenyl-3-methyl-5-hydroxy-6-metoxy-1,4-benzoquinol methylase